MGSQQLLDFWSGYLDILSDFLLNSPAFWFLGLYVGWMVLGIIFKIVHLSDRVKY